jgi:hypothetical protein
MVLSLLASVDDAPFEVDIDAGAVAETPRSPAGGPSSPRGQRQPARVMLARGRCLGIIRAG